MRHSIRVIQEIIDAVCWYAKKWSVKQVRSTKSWQMVDRVNWLCYRLGFCFCKILKPPYPGYHKSSYSWLLLGHAEKEKYTVHYLPIYSCFFWSLINSFIRKAPTSAAESISCSCCNTSSTAQPTASITLVHWYWIIKSSLTKCLGKL